MYCKSCGKECLAEAVACTGCGVPPLKGNKFCQSCGEGTNDEAIMCVKCGGSLKKSSSSIDLSGSADSVGEMKDKLVSSFNDFSNEQKMSVGAAFIMIISSIILPWAGSGSNTATLFDSESMHAFVLIALSIAIIVFNFKNDSEKAKYSSFGAIGYFFIILFSADADISDVTKWAGIGFYLFMISAGASAYFSHKASK